MPTLTERTVKPLPRASVTVRKIGAELNRAVEIKRALQEHDDPKLILDMIEGETDLAEACLVVLEETMEDETLLAGLSETIGVLQQRKSRLERSIETRRNIILMAMEKAGLQTIKGPLATLAVRETPRKTVIKDEALIPARFFVPSDPKIDKAALGEALKAGETIPGAELSNGGVSLNVSALMRGVSVAPLAERLDALMIPEPNTGCHLWLGHLKDNGYGTLGVKDDETGEWYTEHAHIASYETLVGPIPEGHDLDHKCRLRCCINPVHLEPVTRSINLQRSPLMNRQAHKTHCPKGHPYSGTNNRGQRICRTCNTAAQARSRRKNHPCLTSST